MFSEAFYLTYIDTDGKREIYAPTRNLEEAKDWTKTASKFQRILEKNPEHNFKFKIKSSKAGWLKLDL